MENQRLLMKGNEALAEAALQAGCHHFFGYPITPQTEINAYMAKRLPKCNGTYLQAESEVSAINMLMGAAAAGARAMTSSSSPGIALKAEGISYICGCDLPCLIVNVQRCGPGLGGIQPAQGDYFLATKSPGHGDIHLIVLAPSTVQEMVDLTFQAFELAEYYRMPAMILADGLLGQMMEPVSFPQRSVTPSEKPWAVQGTGGVREPNLVSSLFLDPDELDASIRNRFERYQHLCEHHSKWEEYQTEDAEIVLTAYGATARICRSAVDQARKMGIKAGLVRPITLYPFPNEPYARLAKSVKQFLCVEMSMGQMVYDVQLAANGACPTSFYGKTGGLVPTPEDVLHEIQKQMGGSH